MLNAKQASQDICLSMTSCHLRYCYCLGQLNSEEMLTIGVGMMVTVSEWYGGFSSTINIAVHGLFAAI